MQLRLVPIAVGTSLIVGLPGRNGEPASLQGDLRALGVVAGVAVIVGYYRWWVVDHRRRDRLSGASSRR